MVPEPVANTTWHVAGHKKLVEAEFRVPLGIANTTGRIADCMAFRTFAPELDWRYLCRANREKTMIIVNARIQATPAAVAALQEAIITMQSATLQEDGCEDYNFSVELADPGAIRVTERWASKNALTAHFKTPHMAAFQAAMQAHPPQEISAHFYEAAEIKMPR